jgi:hypothetical protein
MENSIREIHEKLSDFRQVSTKVVRITEVPVPEKSIILMEKRIIGCTFTD